MFNLAEILLIVWLEIFLIYLLFNSEETQKISLSSISFINPTEECKTNFKKT
jgi:hypothetical protein